MSEDLTTIKRSLEALMHVTAKKIPAIEKVELSPSEQLREAAIQFYRVAKRRAYCANWLPGQAFYEVKKRYPSRRGMFWGVI